MSAQDQMEIDGIVPLGAQEEVTTTVTQTVVTDTGVQEVSLPATSAGDIVIPPSAADGSVETDVNNHSLPIDGMDVEPSVRVQVQENGTRTNVDDETTITTMIQEPAIAIATTAPVNMDGSKLTVATGAVDAAPQSNAPIRDLALVSKPTTFAEHVPVTERLVTPAPPRMTRTGYIYDPLMMLHCADGYTPTADSVIDNGAGHPEEPMRIKRIFNRLAESGLIKRMKKLQFEQATLDQVLLVHSEDHWNKVQGTESEFK